MSQPKGTSRHEHCSGIKDSLCDPTPAPTIILTEAPIKVPSPSPSTEPTITESSTPSTQLTVSPSTNPTGIPSNGPSLTISEAPSAIPSTQPSFTPSTPPSTHPSNPPSTLPSTSPTVLSSTAPSNPPSISFAPTLKNEPSSVPSKSSVPSHVPSIQPSPIPSKSPSTVPSKNPTAIPSSNPSQGPSVLPSRIPTSIPSSTTSENPTQIPTVVPTILPSTPPTMTFSHLPSNLPSLTSSAPPSKEWNDPTLDPNDSSRRFIFVDLKDGLWSTYRSDIYKHNPIIECPIGAQVIFHYPNYYHDVVAMADAQHYDDCNFDDSVTLAPLVQNPDYTSVTYYHNCTTPGKMDYISCSIPGHCAYGGQKIQIRTSTNITTRDEVTGEWLIHVRSLDRILRLLGRRYDPITNFLILDRGYQTEELADQTMEWIWCGLDHCPSFSDISSSDVSDGGGSDASYVDCEGAIHTLMGFVSRKRPIPQYEKAEEYYKVAIDGGGVEECAARSYLTELYLDKLDFVSAIEAANQLCEACGTGDDDDVFGNSVRQAKYAFDSLSDDLVTWPMDGPCGGMSGEAPSPFPSVLDVRSGVDSSCGYVMQSSSQMCIYLMVFAVTTMFSFGVFSIRIPRAY